MVGLFIGFLTSGLSFVKNLAANFMVFGRSSLLYFYFSGDLKYFLKYLYFRPNEYGPFLLQANLPFLVGGFLRSELRKYC